MKLDPKKPLWKNIQFRLSKYEMEAGILEDVKRKKPLFGQFKTYAGQTVLKTGRMADKTKPFAIWTYSNRHRSCRKKWQLFPLLKIVQI